MKPFALLALGAGLLLGCQKDNTLFVKSPPSLCHLLQAYSPAQRFTFALNQPQVLTTTGGATLSFPANAFRMPDGRTLATGQAELRVREAYAVPDMLLANLPTTGFFENILLSDGEFNIQVWQGTNRLRLPANTSAGGAAPGLVLSTPMPGSGRSTSQMFLLQQPTRTCGDTSSWRNSSVLVDTVPPNRYTVTLPLDSMGSWNIARGWGIYQNFGVSAATVLVPAGATETRVYFRPVGYNGLAQANGVPGATATRFAARLPLGAPMVAVVLQSRNGLLHYGTQAVTTRVDQVIQPRLEELPEAEIIRRIRLL